MISGYCHEGDERDGWDDSGADHSACMPDTPFECSCDCHDWSEQEMGRRRGRRGVRVKILELSPAPHEVAVARIPAGVSVLVPGHPSVPRAGKARYAAVPGAALGWGAYVCTWGSAAGIAYHHHRRDRAVWQHAAKMLAREILHDDSMAVLYVVHEQAEEHGKPVWAAVRIRQENRA